ncbi:hypothetical protein T484DRAFT_1954387 [Baffinella frigidus]|nr:hypothetical protein T484DRAFT_1954387 [Cryptophyta sp. CCMP2293]
MAERVSVARGGSPEGVSGTLAPGRGASVTRGPAGQVRRQAEAASTTGQERTGPEREWLRRASHPPGTWASSAKEATSSSPRNAWRTSPWLGDAPTNAGACATTWNLTHTNRSSAFVVATAHAVKLKPTSRSCGVKASCAVVPAGVRTAPVGSTYSSLVAGTAVMTTDCASLDTIAAVSETFTLPPMGTSKNGEAPIEMPSPSKTSGVMYGTHGESPPYPGSWQS